MNVTLSFISTDRRWLVSWLGVAILIFLYSTEIQQRTEWEKGSDFYKFYLSSQYLRQNKNFYWSAPIYDAQGRLCNDRHHSASNPSVAPVIIIPAPIEITTCLHPNLNPPIFTVLTTPLSWFPYPLALWIWSLLSTSCGILALRLIFRAQVWKAVRSSAAAMLIGVAFFAYFPTFANISYGQVSLFILLLLTLSWLALRRGAEWKAGIWLGIAASLKPFIGLFLLTLVFSRNWRMLTSFLFMCAGLFWLGGLGAGFSAYPAYQAALDGITWQAASWNASFAGFFMRIFGGSENSPWIDMPILAHGFIAISSLIVISILARVLTQLPLADHIKRTDALFALTIPAMLLLSPLGWIYYFPLLLISLVVILNLVHNSPKRRIYWLILLLCAVLTMIPTTLIPSEAMNEPLAWVWSAAVYFYSLLILFLLLTVNLEKIKKQ